MIKVNLIKSRKKTTITIPFGWIFVALFSIACFGGLYLYNEQCETEFREKEAELDQIKKRVNDLKRYERQKKQLLETKRTLVNERNRYENVLSASAGGWTPTFLLFEDLLQKAKTVWFKDLRIDSDGRVSIQAVSMGQKKKPEKSMPGITTLYEEISNQKTRFKSVRLKRVQKAREQGKDVRQFELTCVLIR